MYFYSWNQRQILPEKSLIRKFRLLLTFYTIQYLHSYDKSNLDSRKKKKPTDPKSANFFFILYIIYKLSYSALFASAKQHYAGPSRGSLHATCCVYEQVANADCECPQPGASAFRNFEMHPLKVLSFFKNRRFLRKYP